MIISLEVFELDNDTAGLMKFTVACRCDEG